MAIEFIYFDLGQVILKFDHAQGCRQVAKLMGTSEARIRQVVFDSGLQDRFESGSVTADEFHQEVCQAIGVDCDRDRLLLAASDIFLADETMLGLIAKFANRGFPRGLLSNTCIAHWQHIQTAFQAVDELLPVKILSFEVNAMKPAAVIYERAIRAAGYPADRIFFVDDRPDNVAGAIAAGIDAVLYRSFAELIEQLDDRGIAINP